MERAEETGLGWALRERRAGIRGQQGHGAAAVPGTSEGPLGPGSCWPLSCQAGSGRAGTEREEEGGSGGGIGNWLWAQVVPRAGWPLGPLAFLGQTQRGQIGLAAQGSRGEEDPKA